MASTDAERGRYGSPAIVPAAAWLKILFSFAIALAAVYVVLPSGGGETPPVRTLVATAAIIGVLTIGALVWALMTDLGFPVQVVVLTAVFNGIIVFVKFVLAPRGVYEVNQTVDVSGIYNITDEVGAVIAAVVVFLLYLGAFVVLYRIARRRLVSRAPGRSWIWARNLVIVLLVGAGLFAVGGALVAVILLPLIVAEAGIEYLSFVFTSSFALLIGLALAGAAALAALALRTTAERARVAGDVALLVAFFWLGVAFLALYHALWVVYILVLSSTWPLKVVVPK